jgi:4-diphosphocytidyl-2-C-methyl-D-erythritol kinase
VTRLPGPGWPAPAKLNLFLHVTGRRADGYHLLQSVFVLIDRCDTVRIAVRGDGIVRRVNDVPGVPAEEDLAVRAAEALQAATGCALGADIEVEKRIPMGGGLGGGSSDAATVLLALDGLWKLDLGPGRLQEIGLGLGADVPFFVGGRNAWVEGIGERIAPIDVPPRWYAVLVPPVHVATRDIFTAPELTRDSEPLKMEDFSAQPRTARFVNDLEAVAVSRYPQVRSHLQWLRQYGQARMTGSGGCVFAGFDSREAAQGVIDALPATMQGFIAQGLTQHPLRARGVAAP